MITYLAKLKQEKEGFMTCFHDMNNKKSPQKLSEGSLSSSGWQDSNGESIQLLSVTNPDNQLFIADQTELSAPILGLSWNVFMNCTCL